MLTSRIEVVDLYRGLILIYHLRSGDYANLSMEK